MPLPPRDFNTIGPERRPALPGREPVRPDGRAGRPARAPRPGGRPWWCSIEAPSGDRSARRSSLSCSRSPRAGRERRRSIAISYDPVEICEASPPRTGSRIPCCPTTAATRMHGLGLINDRSRRPRCVRHQAEPAPRQLPYPRRLRPRSRRRDHPEALLRKLPPSATPAPA